MLAAKRREQVLHSDVMTTAKQTLFWGLNDALEGIHLCPWYPGEKSPEVRSRGSNGPTKGLLVMSGVSLWQVTVDEDTSVKQNSERSVNNLRFYTNLSIQMSNP